jgi:hypothetical protein
MKVRFVQRNMITEQVLPAGLTVSVREYTRHVFGGPKSCELEVSGPENMLVELSNWLRNRIEIFDDQGNPVWWGLVSRVDIPRGEVTISADLEEMANAVAVAYTLTNTEGEATGARMTTPWYEDVESIQKYGRKELLLSASEINAMQADALARRKLQEGAFPRVSAVTGSSPNVAIITGSGEWETLGWQYANVPTKLALSFQRTGTGESYALTAPEIKLAQSFKVSTDFNLAEIGLHLARVGSPGELKVELCEYFDATMPGEVLDGVTIPMAAIGLSAGWVKGFLEGSYPVELGGRYYLVISCDACDQSNYYKLSLDGSKSYPDGTFRINVSSGWQSLADDVPFKLFQNSVFKEYTTLGTGATRLNALYRGVAQQFSLSASKAISELRMYLKRVGDPGKLTIGVHQDATGMPGDKISSGTVEAVDVQESFGWHAALLEKVATLDPGTFWIAMTASQADDSNYYEFKTDTAQGFGEGGAAVLPNGIWVDGDMDLVFRTQNSAIVASFTTMTSNYELLQNNDDKLVQSFRLSSASNISRIQVWVKKVGNPGDLTVGISSAAEDEPGGGSLGSGTIEALDISAADFGWYMAKITAYPRLPAYTRFFIEFSASNLDGSNYYLFQMDQTGAYPGENAWRLAGGTWTSLTVDLPFILSGSTDGASFVGTVNGVATIGGTYSSAAQSFIATSSAEMLKLEMLVRKVGLPGDLTIGLYSDVAGTPGALLGYGSKDRRLIGSGFEWHGSWLNNQAAINNGQVYWIVVSSNEADASNYYEIGSDTNKGFAWGACKLLGQSSSWTGLAADLPFKILEPVAGHQHTTIGSIVSKLGVDWPMIAQKVVPSTAMTLTGVGLHLNKVGQPGGVLVEVCSNSNGFPGEVLGSADLPGDDISTSPGFHTAALDEPLSLPYTADGYFLVISTTGSSSISYIEMRLDTTAGYTAGFGLKKEGEIWAEGAGDMPFRLYANEIVETSQMVQNLLTAYGQFFKGVFVNDPSDLGAESYRSGDTTAAEEIEKLLEIGTINGLRMLARVNYDRTVEVWEMPDEAAPAVEMREDGQLWFRTGVQVAPSFDPTGKWISVEPLLRSVLFTNNFTGSQQFFVDGTRWDAAGKPSLTPANWTNPLSRRGSMQDG